MDSIRNILLSLSRAVTAIVLLSSLAFSQIYPFKHYSAADGLVQSSVISIFQDSRGYLWFGTLGGVSRYDGSLFQSYLSKGPHRSIAKAFLEDQGMLWIATEGNGVALLDMKTDSVQWLTRDHGDLPTDSVYCLLDDPEGNRWMGTRVGVYILLKSGATVLLDLHNGLPANWINGLALDGKGRVWIASNGGVSIAQLEGSGTVKVKTIFHHRSLAIAALQDGSVAVGTDETPTPGRGVFRFRGDTPELLVPSGRYHGGLKTQWIQEDAKGNLFVGTSGHGCLVLGQGRLRTFDALTGLRSDNVGVIFEDREETLWLGTPDGLDKLPRRSFRRYLPNHGIHTLRIEHNRIVWTGGFDGLRRTDPSGHSETITFTNPSSQIHSLAQDRRGNLWIGTNHGVFVRQGGLIHPVPGPDPHPLYAALLIDKNQSLWLGNSDGNILCMHDGKIVQRFGSAEGLPSVGISTLALDHQGWLWFGTEGGGAGFIENGSVHRLTEADGLPHPMVESISEDSRGRLWIATRGGVAYWESEAMHRLREPVLGNSPVFFALETRDHHLWFGTWSGLFEWSDSVVARFDTHEGLPSQIMNCGIEDEAGNLWFGTGSGFCVLDNAERSVPVPVPSLLVHRVQNDREDVVLKNRSSIPYDERMISFRLTALSFVDEEGIAFQHMLGGFDEDWRPSSTQRVFRYTTLPAGGYVFRARAANHNGAWSAPVSYAFEVLPPFWETWWFRFLVILAISISLTILYRYRVARLLELERLRLRIASDLHDEIGSYLGGIALQSELALRKGAKADDLNSKLTTISSLAHRTVESIRDMVWIINPEHDSLQTLVAKMRAVAGEMLGDTSVDFTAPDSASDQPLDLEFKRNVFLIYREALHNIQKHAQAQRVEIVLSVKDSSMILEMSDDGVGFEKETVTGGHGLTSMQHRATTIGGSLLITKKPEGGTRLRVEARIP